jgi:hypothetical protein
MIFFFSMRYQRAILVFSVGVVVLSVALISRIEVNNYLLEDVGKDDPMRYSFEYFERYFAGARPFELQVDLVDSNASIFDQGPAMEMLEVENYLKAHYGVGFVISPLTILRSAHQAMNGGLDDMYVIPEDAESFERLQRNVRLFRKRPEFNSLVTKDDRSARISGKIKDPGGKQVKLLNEALVHHFTVERPLEHIEIRLTGMALLIDKNNETLSFNMMTGLLFALGVVAMIMGIIFKSLRMAIITLIPNILPLLVIGGVMGALGFDLKVSTSIIFGIAFGIAVDDSIHYLSKYKLELNKGRSSIWALRRTSISTGKAIILTSIILSAGFITLATSDFTSTFYVGLLISITLLVAVIADLFVLPVLIYRFSKKRKG